MKHIDCMSSQRTVKIKRGTKIRRQSNNNAMIFKLADPIIQCCIFVYFLYCLDAAIREPSYRTVLLGLIAYQYGSAVLNFLLMYRDPRLFRKERIIHIITISCYMPIFFFAEKHVKEYSFGINELDRPYIHLFQSIFMGIAIVIAFWYFYICYREIRNMLSGAAKMR